MQNLTLHDIHYTELDPVTMTWCATAQVRAVHSYHNQQTNTHLSAPQIAYNQRQLQRTGVRLLLQALLKKLAITDSLDESGFPYRLIDSQYYVCFSHTSGHSEIATHIQNDREDSDIPYIKVAVIINSNRAAGIDIELNTVKWQVAQRFYHPKELAILQAMSLTERNTIIKYLWQMKESSIKIHQYTLAQGLGMDYSAIIPDLIKQTTDSLSLLTITDDASGYRIAAIDSQQTIIVC